MVNTSALASLTAHIDNWITVNCSEKWWTDQVGYMTDGTAERMAFLVLTALYEAKCSTEYAEKESA